MTTDTKILRSLAEKALAESEPDWQYIDGPLVGDVCVETRPQNPGRSRIRFDPNSALGPFVAACNPQTVVGLLDEIERLKANRDHSCACSVNDGSAPLVKHDKDCPIRVNARKRIAPEVALQRLAAALDDGDEVDSLRSQLAAMTAARDRLYEIAKGTFDRLLMTKEIAVECDELRKVGAK